MNRNRKQLMDEVLTGEELGAFRRQSLDYGLAEMRTLARRRRWRRNAALVSLVALLLSLAALPWLRPTPSTSTASLAKVSPAAPPTPAASSIQPINDQELLALFPHQTVALIGSPGHQRLLVFEAQGPFQ